MDIKLNIRHLGRAIKHLVILLLVLLLFAIPIVAAILIEKQQPYDLEIVPGPTSLIFLTADNISLDGPIHFGQVARGTSVSAQFYVKNNGTETISSINATLSPASVSWGTVTISPASVGTLAPGQSKLLTLTLNISSSATPGKHLDGKVIVTGNGP